MTDYRSSTTVRVSPTTLFDYLSRVENLPDYFARMRTAERVDEPGNDGSTSRQTVRTSAELPDGQVVEGEAWFEVDREARTVRWGSEGPNDYHGELTVADVDGGAGVQVLISTARTESEQVQEGVERTVATIREKVEAQHAGSPAGG